jgi:hypothetical protein
MFFVNQDSTTVFTNNDFFVLANFALTLWRDGIVASATCISQHGNNCLAVSEIFSDSVKGS